MKWHAVAPCVDIKGHEDVNEEIFTGHRFKHSCGPVLVSVLITKLIADAIREHADLWQTAWRSLINDDLREPASERPFDGNVICCIWTLSWWSSDDAAIAVTVRSYPRRHPGIDIPSQVVCFLPSTYEYVYLKMNKIYKVAHGIEKVNKPESLFHQQVLVFTLNIHMRVYKEPAYQSYLVAHPYKYNEQGD